MMPSHPRVVIAGGWRGYGRDRRLLFKRWIPRWRVVLRERRQAACPHPLIRQYAGISHDGVLWAGCRDCGTILSEDHGYGARSKKAAAAMRKQEKKREKAKA